MSEGEFDASNVPSGRVDQSLHEVLDLDELDKFEFGFTVPFFFSSNSMFIPVPRGKINKHGNKVQGASLWGAPEVVTLKEHIRSVVKPFDPLLVEKTISATIYAQLMAPYKYWMFSNGKMKKVDNTNLWKPIEDGIVEASGVDDSKYEKIEVEKVVSPQDILEVWCQVILYGKL